MHCFPRLKQLCFIQSRPAISFSCSLRVWKFCSLIICVWTRSNSSNTSPPLSPDPLSWAQVKAPDLQHVFCLFVCCQCSRKMSWHQDTTSLNLLWHINMLNQEKKAVWMLFLSQCKCLWKEGVSMCSSFSSLSILKADKLQNPKQRQASTLSPSTMWLLTYPRNKPCGKFLSDLRRINFAVSFAFHVLTSDAGFGASLVTWQPTCETSMKCPMRPEPDQNEGTFWRDNRVGKTAREIRLKWLLKQKKQK